MDNKFRGLLFSSLNKLFFIFFIAENAFNKMLTNYFVFRIQMIMDTMDLNLPILNNKPQIQFNNM